MLENPSWEEARDLLLSLAKETDTEDTPLEECMGRVLAFDLTASGDVPPFDRSAYDGYAMRSKDLEGAGKDRPVTLRITETIPAGSVPSRPVVPGTAARLMTGAKIPEGADCVINFERTEFTFETVTVFQTLKKGDNIVRRGEDVAAGTLLAPRGTVIDPGLAGTLAAQGIARVRVYRKPVVALVSTGSEVVEADSEEGPGKIRNANRAAFTALLKMEGCRVRYMGLAGDDAAEIASLISRGLEECDAVIITGGVSVGDWDVTPDAMALSGAEVLVRGVSMKPGMACAYAACRGKPVLGLSGNPASALTNYCACVLPAVRRMCGRAEALPVGFTAEMAEGFGKKSPSERFLRGRLRFADGRTLFVPSARQGNAVLSSAIGCDAYARIPAGSGPVEQGRIVSGFML
ncbi:MAG: molybdopterin molybdotransferase MoeA [Clostridia bacterium]|nr:molybdopterin molybdotransferase MoeA [Clostridia bacterium]